MSKLQAKIKKDHTDKMNIGICSACKEKGYIQYENPDICERCAKNIYECGDSKR